jgi:hypothetical protein
MGIVSKNRIKDYRNKIIVAKIFYPKLVYAGGIHAA